MSHTFRGMRAMIFYNGDFSGDVTIMDADQEVVVPFDDIKQFIAEYIRRKKTRDLECMPSDMVLFDSWPVKHY